MINASRQWNAYSIQNMSLLNVYRCSIWRHVVLCESTKVRFSMFDDNNSKAISGKVAWQSNCHNPNCEHWPAHRPLWIRLTTLLWQCIACLPLLQKLSVHHAIGIDFQRKRALGNPRRSIRVRKGIILLERLLWCFHLLGICTSKSQNQCRDHV